MKRSSLIAATAAAAVALPAGRAWAQSDVVRFGSVPVEEGMLPFYADAKGFFKAAGLNVQVQQFPNGGSVTQGVLGGALDVGVTNSGSLSSAHARGVPIYLLACGALYSPQSPISHVAVNKTAGIKTAKDLAGKTLAVSTLHDMIQATVLAWIDKNGGDYKTVNFVEMPPPQMAEAIVAKRIDGSALVEPFFTRAKADLGDLGTNYSAANDGKPFQTLGIVAAKDWADKNTPLAKKLAGAIHETATWANNPKNHDECATILGQITKIEPAVIAAYPRLTFAESNSPGFVQPVVDLMFKYAFIPKTFVATELFVPGVA
jgi:NitT/TauT family transport system substrate-binding protein